MAQIRVQNLPPFADNECLHAILGEYIALISRAKWGKYRSGGAEYACVDLSVPDDILQLILNMFKRVEVLGNPISASAEVPNHEKSTKDVRSRYEKKIPRKDLPDRGKRESDLSRHVPKEYKVARIEQENKVGIIENIVSSNQYGADECKHCGSTAHFSRKCPSKSMK